MSFENLWQEYIASIKDQALLKKALTHSSKSREHDDVEDNERLEYLGDAVLKLCFTRFLYDKYPKHKEGLLTKYRAKLISDKLLAKLALKLDIPKHIVLGSTIARSDIPNSVIGDTVEALIGALYLDAGYERAAEFILALWQDEIEQAITDAIDLEFKSRLQELIQEKFKTLPEYKVLAESGPDHKKEFEIGVYLDAKLLAKASSFSKKEASQKAAKKALGNKKQWLS